MNTKTRVPGIFFDKVGRVAADEGMVRVSALAGAHALDCLLTPEEARALYAKLGALLHRMRGD